MKKLFIFAMCAMAMASCNEGAKKAEAQAQAERDSLNQVIAQKDDEINDMMTTLIDIEEGFREITEAQSRVTLAKNGQITEMKEQLELKNIHIGELKYAINTMREDARALQDENEAQSKTINAQDKQLNTAWYACGTEKELKGQQILVKGKVLQGNFNKDYFTKIDTRVDNTIKLYSKSAKLLTTHPSSSYTLQPDANKQLTLRITDPQAFWSTSKYLVVQVK